MFIMNIPPNVFSTSYVVLLWLDSMSNEEFQLKKAIGACLTHCRCQAYTNPKGKVRNYAIKLY